MDDELFDIVDEENKVIGQALRKEVHTRGYIHRTVSFYLFDRLGRVFVNQRVINKEFYPERWSIAFGGHVQAGETYNDAVLREAKEEAGVKGKPTFITYFKKRFDKEDKENVRVYGFITDREPKLDPHELKQGQFMTMKELEQKMKEKEFLPETPKLLQIIRKYVPMHNIKC